MRLCESLQNGWSGDRHPARKPDDYAKEAKIAVDKGFDAIKMNFLTFKEDEGRYPHYRANRISQPTVHEDVRGANRSNP